MGDSPLIGMNHAETACFTVSAAVYCKLIYDHTKSSSPLPENISDHNNEPQKLKKGSMFALHLHSCFVKDRGINT